MTIYKEVLIPKVSVFVPEGIIQKYEPDFLQTVFKSAVERYLGKFSDEAFKQPTLGLAVCLAAAFSDSVHDGEEEERPISEAYPDWDLFEVSDCVVKTRVELNREFLFHAARLLGNGAELSRRFGGVLTGELERQIDNSYAPEVK